MFTFRHGSGRRLRETSRRRLDRRVEQLEERTLLTATPFSGIPEWVEQGPGPITFGIASSSNTTTYSQVGAVEAIAVHPTDPAILYIAALNGGIWKTENAQYSRLDSLDNDLDSAFNEPGELPSWRPLTDRMPGLSMGAIAFDPLDSTHETLYAGTGMFSSLQGVAGPRGGLLRTADGGTTWTELAASTFRNQNVESIVPTTVTTPTGQVILVATNNGNGGIFRSVDGGATFARVSGTGNLPPTGVTQLVADPSDAQRFYAGIPRRGVYRTADGGATWESINAGIAGYASAVRISLAVHANTSAGTNAVYAAILRFVDNGKKGKGDRLTGLFRSDDAGQTWDALSSIPNTGYQGGLNFAMLADRNDAHRVYVGGQNGNFAVDAEAGTWASISGSGANKTGSHSDHRFFAYDLNGNILDANDGGIYRLVNPTSLGRRWEALNDTLRTTEVNSTYSLSYDSLNNIILTGTQDNGTAQQWQPGSIEYEHVAGGDGNSSLIAVEGNRSYRYVMGNNYHSLERHIFDQHNQLVTKQKVNLAAAATPTAPLSGMTLADQDFNAYSQFPLVLNEYDVTRFLLGTGSALYETDNRGDTITNITPGGTAQRVFAFAYGGRQSGVDNPDVIYVGLVTHTQPETPQVWLRENNTSGFRQLATYPGSRPAEIQMDPNDWRVAYVLDANSRIWRTADAGGSWTDLAAGSAVLTGKQLRALEVVRIGGTPVLLAGGDGGLYRRISPDQGTNAASWSEFGRGLAHAPVIDIVYDATDDLLLVGTVGRGVWTIPKAATWLPWISTLTINGDLNDDGTFAAPNRNDVIRLAINPDNNTRLDVFVNNVGGGPQYSIEHAAVQMVDIYAKGGDDFIQIDSLPEQTSVTVYGGAGRDVIYTASTNVRSDIELRGGEDADWFLVTPTAAADIYAIGGSPSVRAAEGDTLRVLTTRTPFTITPTGVGEGLVRVTGFNPIRYFEMEEALGAGPIWRADRLEANDTAQQPYDLITGDQTQLNLTIHEPGNNDWYAWEATRTGPLVVELVFDHELGDLNLGLYSESGSLLALADSTDDNEHLVWNVAADQSYLVRVYGYNNATHPNYTLEIDWPFGFPDDSLEDNDSFAQARNLGSGDQTRGDLAVTPVSEFVEDEDWFRWTSPAGGWLTVEAEFLHTLGNLELELRDASNNVLAASTSTTDNESVTRSVSAGETFYIRVYGWAGASQPDYDLRINGPEIQVDRLEPDALDLTDIVDLGAGQQTHTGLTIHAPEDEDWYEWRATDSGAMTTSLLFSQTLGDLDMGLYSADRTLLRSATSTTDNEQIVYNVVAGESYLIQVYGFNGATHPGYDLEITWPFAIAKDALEPNDSLAEAATLGEGDVTLTELTVHSDDGATSNEDWYAWRASEEGSLHVEARFLHALGDLDLELYDPEGTQLAQSNSASDNEELFWAVTPGALYYVRVYGYLEAQHPDYDLSIDGPDLLPDIFELNNTSVQPRDLGMGNQDYAALSIHAPLDDDWYLWRASADGTLSVAVQFAHGLGDIDLELYDLARVQLDQSNSNSDIERVSYAGAVAGQQFLVRVFGYNGATNRSYTLEIVGPTIPADALEPNDRFADAWDLGSGGLTVENLSIHEPGNSDWFRWTAPANGRLSVDVLFGHDTGNVNAELFDGAQSLLASSLSVTDNEHLSWQVTDGQDYYVHIRGAVASVVPTILIDPRRGTDVSELQRNYDLAITFVPDPSSGADFDLDGDVDGDDFLIWQSGFGSGTTHSDGDADGSGEVDGDDFLIWQASFGAGGGRLAAASSVATTRHAAACASELRVRDHRESLRLAAVARDAVFAQHGNRLRSMSTTPISAPANLS